MAVSEKANSYEILIERHKHFIRFITHTFYWNVLAGEDSLFYELKRQQT